MNAPFPTAGLWMLATLGLLIVGTGLPVWALLIGSASLFAAAGVASGAMDVGVLSAISGRTLGLLEHDLLQALPLYVFIGVLLQRLTVADTLFSGFARLLGRTGAGTSLAAMGVGALIAPMNGSVASSSALLARLVTPRLGRLDNAAATALVSVSATIGVVVPPSLVLILLGDAMLRAHTEASNLSSYVLGSQRIINTQDVFHAAMLPAATVLVLWLIVAWWQGRRFTAQMQSKPLSGMQWAQSATLVVATLLLLTGVFLGKVYAVEAAATGGVVLVIATLASRALNHAQWRSVLTDTLSLSGALLALLVGATTFSLVFRLWGTDHWIADVVLGSSLPHLLTAALVLLLVALCAWVLDAFEMIFVIIPIVAPPLIALLGDAQQTAVLLLLVLQLSFLIPPMGYAVMMARARSTQINASIWLTLRALLPYLAVQSVVTVLVFIGPWTVHQLDAAVAPASQNAPVSNTEVEQLMRDMADQPTQPPLNHDFTSNPNFSIAVCGAVVHRLYRRALGAAPYRANDVFIHSVCFGYCVHDRHCSADPRALAVIRNRVAAHWRIRAVDSWHLPGRRVHGHFHGSSGRSDQSGGQRSTLADGGWCGLAIGDAGFTVPMAGPDRRFYWRGAGGSGQSWHRVRFDVPGARHCGTVGDYRRHAVPKTLLPGL